FICEVKRASPSKGMLVEEFPYVQIAKDYEEAGADCISVLTEPDYFKGDKQYLKEISENVTVPLIRKDFIIDEYMIYDAKIHGASCVLLICSLLDKETMEKYIEICDNLGMSALVEAHDEEEIQKAVEAGARMIGVNNRDLKTFTVDIGNSERLRKLVPDNILFIAESGIKTNADINRLRKAKVNGVLIGETFMKAENKKEMLQKLRGV
ncbi:MAG: indole-3-glycerol phosphate synthase TrpC, partial [Eubacterium sp.]|nr:indole-3-glycerol phosphate synthase TrpC [Eubacterium sp.]